MIGIQLITFKSSFHTRDEREEGGGGGGGGRKEVEYYQVFIYMPPKLLVEKVVLPTAFINSCKSSVLHMLHLYTFYSF